MSASLDFQHISRFTSEAIESLLALQKQARRIYPKSAAEMSETIRLLRAANKFSLPDNGILLDLKDYRPDYAGMLRLPYPIVTLECAMTWPTLDGAFPSSKSIIMAWSAEAETTFKINTAPPAVIYFTHVWYDDEQSAWEPSPVVWGFDPLELEKGEDGEFVMTGFHHCPCHPEAYERFSGDDINRDLEMSFRPLLEFCLTVNCENIKTEVLAPPDKLAKKRIKNNREPFYSYHVLLIPGGGEGDGNSSQSGRDGPRVHWRRGHLRRLQSGSVIWVRHTLVGSAENGLVDKSYAVRSLGG